MKTLVETKHESPARDADERRAEAEAAQQRFSNLLNPVEGIDWEADASTFKFSFVSRQTERILGHPIERWLGEPTFWKDHIHPDEMLVREKGVVTRFVGTLMDITGRFNPVV